jgi:hypothetical protein
MSPGLASSELSFFPLSYDIFIGYRLSAIGYRLFAQRYTLPHSVPE